MTNSKKVLLGAVALAALTASSAAYAADWSLAGSLAVQSDYRFRGISQNAKKFAGQGSVNLTGPEGWYLGTWLSQVDWDPNPKDEAPQMEWDIYGGKHFDLGEGTDLNVEAYYYAYPAADYPGTKASFFEGIFQLSHSFDAFSVTGTYAVSPDFSFKTGVSHYVAGTLSVPILDFLSFSANVGHQWVEMLPDYTHADAGLTATWKSFSLDARYVTTDMNLARCSAYMTTRTACSGGAVVTLTYNMALLP